MKKLILLLLAASLFIASPSFAKTYGKGVTLEETTLVSVILDNPDDYIGKMVRIEGMIIDVCSKRGCWMYVAGDRPHEKIQIKVLDGEIVFPMSAMGHIGIVEGIVEELQMSEQDKLNYLKHMAEEKGKPFDPSHLDSNKRFIRLVGLGAEINE
ncbi:DUF4920 domain-containing protein [Desulfosediminicola flagellatus]|uniref:DUF4920 domain-containing protein n=1 Tax=Desulfosediminicola flagellatus TaxID=2569541 RepID=UPI0010AB5A55|nr:DUF4920 domain-containing protein [Desulfosediminicola flagellatus]